MFKHTEYLFFKRIFWNPIIVIQGCLSRPTDKKRRSNICFGPIENLSYFIPISNLFKIQMLNRCTGYYQTIILMFLNFIKSYIKRFHMLNWRILGSMTFQLDKL